jgi:hypothetical protein
LVRGSKAIQRVLELTAAEELLVLVDDPDDLAPPPAVPQTAASADEAD